MNKTQQNNAQQDATHYGSLKKAIENYNPACCLKTPNCPCVLCGIDRLKTSLNKLETEGNKTKESIFSLLGPLLLGTVIFFFGYLMCYVGVKPEEYKRGYEDGVKEQREFNKMNIEMLERALQKDKEKQP